MKKYKYGKLPVNARISIDYTGKEPKIKFGYPGKQDAVKQNVGFMFIILFVIFFFAAFTFFINFEKLFPPAYFTSCNITEGKEGDYIRNLTIICEGENPFHKEIRFQGELFKNPSLKYLTEIFRDSDLYIDKTITEPQKLISVGIGVISFFLYLLIIPYFLAIPLTKLFLKTDWYKAKIPDINKAISGRGYKATFEKVPKEKYIEIPLFKNVQLDYHTTKEFSKYLAKVEIKEHPFLENVLKKKKYKKNVWLWYARFYYSKIPKTGKLEVQFK